MLWPRNVIGISRSTLEHLSLCYLCEETTKTKQQNLSPSNREKHGTYASAKWKKKKNHWLKNRKSPAGFPLLSAKIYSSTFLEIQPMFQTAFSDNVYFFFLFLRNFVPSLWNLSPQSTKADVSAVCVRIANLQPSCQTFPCLQRHQNFWVLLTGCRAHKWHMKIRRHIYSPGVCELWHPRLGVNLHKCYCEWTFAKQEQLPQMTLIPHDTRPEDRFIPETNLNSSWIEWTNCCTFQWQFVCSIRDELHFISGVNRPWLDTDRKPWRGPRMCLPMQELCAMIETVFFCFDKLAKSDSRPSHPSSCRTFVRSSWNVPSKSVGKSNIPFSLW